MSDIHFAEDGNRSFTTVSEEALELKLEELSGQASGEFSTLMEELNTEIDRSAVFGVADLQEILSNSVKPLMENVAIESYNLLHLSEHLRPKVLRVVGDVETGDQLDEMDRMRMRLEDLNRNLIRAEEEKLKAYAELRKKLCASENLVQSLQLELRSSQCSIQSLRDYLCRSEDSLQFLKVELKGKEERNHLLLQRLLNESTRLKQKDLDESKDLSRTFRQQLSATEEQNRALQEAPMACKARVQEAEREKQWEVESKEECKKKIRNRSNLFYKGLNSQLKPIVDDLQMELKMSLKTEESLKRTIKKVKAKYKAKIDQLQHTLSEVKEEARQREMTLRTAIIGLKRKLVDEHAVLVRELKKEMKNETKLEETKVKNGDNHMKTDLYQNSQASEGMTF